MEKTYQVASHVVRTKMCPTDVRLVVIRTRSKPSKPYRYFFVFTTDLTLEIPKIVEYYRQRWQIETAFRDAKQHFGFDAYRVKSRKKHQSVRAAEFRCCEFDEVDIYNTGFSAESHQS